jgi:cell division protein FtsB
MISKSRRIGKRNSYQTIFFSILIGSLLILAVGFLVFSNLKISQIRAELTAKIEDFKKEIQILEKKNQELRAGITRTESESYWEERIREQGYKKPGEEQVVVLLSEGGEVKKEEESSLWNPRNWWEWIKSKVRD